MIKSHRADPADPAPRGFFRWRLRYKTATEVRSVRSFISETANRHSKVYGYRAETLSTVPRQVIQRSNTRCRSRAMDARYEYHTRRYQTTGWLLSLQTSSPSSSRGRPSLKEFAALSTRFRESLAAGLTHSLRFAPARNGPTIQSWRHRNPRDLTFQCSSRCSPVRQVH